MKQCPACHSHLEPDFAFCPECGRPVPREADATVEAVQEPASEPAPVAAAQEVAPPPQAPEASPPPARSFRAIRLSRGGTGTTPYDIPPEGLVIGRESGDIVVPEDPTLSPRHLRLRIDGDVVLAEDSGSLNGVYLRIKTARELEDGDYFVCGDSVFRLSRCAGIRDAERMRHFHAPSEPPIRGTVTRILEDGRDGPVFALRRFPFVFGREDGEARFPADRFMSRRHSEIAFADDRLTLADLGSRNGTYIRCEGDLRLSDGDILLIGRQLLRIEAIAQ